ncbi:MAG: FkbM family methyltransferase, partial [Chloroflexota bacterium]
MKEIINGILGKFGYGLHRTFGSNLYAGFNSSFLSQLGKPRTVIDVGVGYGTHALYEAYPQARFILVEPLREYKDAIDKILKKYDCTVIYKAVGDAEGIQEFFVDVQDLQRSTFAGRTALTSTGDPIEKRTIEVTTLDTICREIPGIEQPILLKIDTEGHELSVLKGAGALLQIVDMVIAEVSVAERFEGSYEFEDLILFMKEH